MKFLKCVGAISKQEVEGIFICTGTKENERCCMILNGFQNDFPEKIPFGNDAEAMNIIKQVAAEGPYSFLVIFYEE